MRILSFALICLIAPSVSAQQYQIDWVVEGLSTSDTIFTSLSLDLDVLPRYIDANGVIKHTGGIFFRPLDGTCILETTETLICSLRLDALSVELRLGLGSGLNGTIQLINTVTTEFLGSGNLILTVLE